MSTTTITPDSQYWVSLQFILRRLETLFVFVVYLKRTLRGRSLNLNEVFATLLVRTLHNSFETKF